MGFPTSPSATSPRWLRAALPVLAVHGVLFCVAEYLFPVPATQGTLLRFYFAIGFVPLQATAMVALWIAGRRQELSRGTRRSLQLLAGAFAAPTLGNLIAFTYFLRGAVLPYVSWADLVYFQFYPFLVAGLLSLPGVFARERRGEDPIGRIVVLLAFGALITFAVTVETRTGDLTLLRRIALVLSSAVQLVSLVIVNRAIERATSTPSRRAVTLLLVGLAISLVGDLLYQLLFATGYRAMNWSVCSSVLTLLLTISSAIHFLDDRVREPDAMSARHVTFNLLPIVAVSAMAVLIAALAANGVVAGIRSLTFALVSLNALLIWREVRASRAAVRAIQSATQREATQRLEALVRHSSDAILLLDSDGRLVFASAPAERLFGAPLGTFDGRLFELQLSERDRGDWREFLDELRREGGRAVTHSMRALLSDGSERLIEAVGVDLRNEPAVRGIVVNARDITERQSLEERLRQAQKLEVVGRLAGGVAHDFNNVLTTIIAGTELAQMSLDAKHPATEELTAISGAAQRGAALTRRLLAFVRQEPVRSQSVPLDEVLRELVPLLSRMAGESHGVAVQVANEVGNVRTDRAELEHVLFNLVANARDSMPNGGPISISATVERVTGTLPHAIIAPPAGDHVRLTVRDEGHGMPSDVRDRMFDPFFTQKSGARGTGLGLIGVRPLIEGAKGGIVVESSPSGTAVSLYLPAEGVGPRAPRRVSPAPPVPRVSPPRSQVSVRDGRHRLLLVEDEPGLREQLARLLESRGYAVIPVTSAAEARVAITAESGLSAVISDVMMPGETGLQFAAWLRREHPELPLLLISGHTGADLDREARATQEFGILRKPFTGAELAERLELIIRKPEAR